MASEIDDREIELKGPNKEHFKVKKSILEKFPLFAGMINFNPEKSTFEFDNVGEGNLELIVDWMKYEGSGEMPALIDPETNTQRQLTEWEEDFTKDISDESLVELMIDADYFALKSFMEILTTITSLRIVTYPIAKIRQMFHIAESGYTPQEEQKLESEIQWALRFQD